MRKEHLFIDCDDTLFRTKEHHVAYLNKRYGIESKLHDYTNNPMLDEVLRRYIPDHQLTSDEMYRDISTHFLECTDTHRTVSMVPGAMEAVLELSQKYELWIVTARPLSCRHVVEYLVSRDIPGHIRDMHFVWRHAEGNSFVGIPKLDFMLSIPGKAVAFIDDSVTEIKKAQDTLPSYLFDDHHLNDEVPGIRNRLHSWKEFTELLL